MHLKNENLYLRALEPNDINLLYEWENNPAIWRVSNTLMPFSKFVLEQYLVNAHQDVFTAKQIRLLICLNNHKPIGTIELFDFDAQNARAGVGIMIDAAFQEKGHATQALSLLCHYCFEILMLKQVYCNISASNTKSLHLFKKIGFVEVGLKKQWNKLTHNTYEDEWLLQLCKN
ncbi:MAG: GNAT family N-acetyltransferase [Bacteroidetes bacterium]|nr:GNAT family N-acetyltransferase [Bacteroidota bacterium]